MRYDKVVEGVFVKRLNRFIAEVILDGRVETVHVPNTGRCGEIFLPESRVILADYEGVKGRKTRYSLVSAYKGDMLINIDSQSPNRIVAEAVAEGGIKEIGKVEGLKREVGFHESKFDLAFIQQGRRAFLEVKGVTLENNGVSCFPDAPTTRGTKHVRHLIQAVKEGYETYLFFLVQLKGVYKCTINKKMDEAFYQAVKEAAGWGVNILVYDSIVTEDEVRISKRIPFQLEEI